MKQILKVEEKLFTSSCNICPEASPHHPYGFGGFFIFKDDVTDILLLSVFPSCEYLTKIKDQCS